MTCGKNTGQIVWFDQKKGFGFVRVVDEGEENKEVFFHFSSIMTENSFKKVYPGEYVSLDVEENTETDDPKKKYNGKNIRGVNGGPLLIDNSEYMFRLIRRRNMYQASAEQEQGQEEEEEPEPEGSDEQ